MLPAAHRLRSSTDFAAVTRRGRRASSGGLVVYVLNPHANGASSAPALSTPPLPAKLGLIVGKSVGGSVTRHQVSRRLRAQLAARLDRVPAGSRWVVRALPAAANAGSDELGRDLDRTLNKLTTPPRQPAKLTETARQ